MTQTAPTAERLPVCLRMNRTACCHIHQKRDKEGLSKCAVLTLPQQLLLSANPLGQQNPVTASCDTFGWSSICRQYKKKPSPGPQSPRCTSVAAGSLAVKPQAGSTAQVVRAGAQQRGQLLLSPGVCRAVEGYWMFRHLCVPQPFCCQGAAGSGGNGQERQLPCVQPCRLVGHSWKGSTVADLDPNDSRSESLGQPSWMLTSLWHLTPSPAWNTPGRK